MTAALTLPAIADRIRCAPVDASDRRELNFVRRAWTEEAGEWFIPDPRTDRRQARQQFITEHSAWVDATLSMPWTAAIVASSVDAHGRKESALGWVAWTRTRAATLLHGLYVKSVYRRMGIGSMLLALVPREASVVLTHANPRSMAWLHVPGEWDFRPDAKWRAVYREEDIDAAA